MIEYNDYCCVSGGSLFDIADRFAHDYVKDKNKGKCCFTSKASCEYFKQCCVAEDIEPKITRTYNNCLTVSLLSRTSGIEYARFKFSFKVKLKAFCQIG